MFSIFLTSGYHQAQLAKIFPPGGQGPFSDLDGSVKSGDKVP